MKQIYALLIASCIALLSASPCSAVITYGFVNAEDPPNSSLDIVSQLYMDVSESSGKALFTIRNTGPIQSTVSGIYFENSLSLLDSIFSIDNSDPGVDFEESTPGNLIGGFSVFAEAEATSPPSKHGVDPGESVGIYFTLSSGTLFEDVINALDEGTIRVGLHAINFPDGESDKFFNTTGNPPTPPPPAVPVPGAVSLGTIALSCLALWRKRTSA